MTMLPSMARCAEPSVASRVLDAVRGGGSLSGANLAHVGVCSSCRGAVERARRIAEVWTGMTPSDREMQRARARFLAARASRRKPRMAPVSLALAVLLFAAAASAAVRVGLKYMHSATVRGHGPEVMAGARPGIGPGSAGNAPDLAPATAAALPVETPAPAAAPAQPRDSTSATDRAQTSEPRAHRVATSAAATTAASAVVEPKASPSAADTVQAWAAAAAAMRAADYPRAEAAFADLTRAADAHTRDAARLARAQVWLAQGRVTEARPELQDLAANGATAGLRSRAAAAIDRLH
jgi:hypothetical protein